VQYLSAYKCGIALDLKSESVKEASLDLVSEADVLLKNFTTGYMAELGLGEETLRDVNPVLVYAHGSGYGDNGPYADYPAMDLTVQAISGIKRTAGFADGEPVKAGPAICDFLGEFHLTLGIVSALFDRTRTSEGCHVEVGMFDCVYPTLPSPVSSWLSRSDAPLRTGNRHPGLAIAPYDVYEVEASHVAIICIFERQWQPLVERISRGDLAEPDGYDSKSARVERAEEIDAILKSWLLRQTKSDVLDALLGDGVPCVPVQTIEEVVEDEHLRERGMANDLPNQGEGRGEVPVSGMPIQFADVDDPDVEQAPHLGEHTEEVLAEIAGYGPEELD
jgi:crotonobetainyl-CoA:carnitine CoA-transferase CaiB-like acyl-CoA transferase